MVLLLIGSNFVGIYGVGRISLSNLGVVASIDAIEQRHNFSFR